MKNAISHKIRSAVKSRRSRGMSADEIVRELIAPDPILDEYLRVLTAFQTSGCSLASLSVYRALVALTAAAQIVHDHADCDPSGVIVTLIKKLDARKASQQEILDTLAQLERDGLRSPSDLARHQTIH